jgi:hypothetical protein
MTYNPTTHSFTSRITPQINPTLKQGSVAMFNGTSSECSLGSAIALQGNWSMMITFNPSVLNVLQYLCSEALTSPTRRFYVTLDLLGKISLQIGTGGVLAISDALILGGTYTLYMSYNATTGVITSKLRTRSTGLLADLADYTVSGLDATTGTFRIGRAVTAGWYSGCIHEFTIWKSIKTVAQMDSTKTDAELAIPFCDSVLDIAENYTVNNANITYQNSDYASFYCEEYGFAEKSGAIYPKLLSGTGYAGNPSAPYTEYDGLIKTKGTINIAAFNLLGTLVDFAHDPNTEIEDAGISWDEWDGEDTNEDMVGTAETDLDTDYYNAITASLMTNTSIAGYAGTSNVSKRLFFKVADRVMKDDGSFLAESGRVQEILVYKADLTAGQIAKVRKYCKDTGV